MKGILETIREVKSRLAEAMRNGSKLRKQSHSDIYENGTAPPALWVLP